MGLYDESLTQPFGDLPSKVEEGLHKVFIGSQGLIVKTSELIH